MAWSWVKQHYFLWKFEESLLYFFFLKEQIIICLRSLNDFVKQHGCNPCAQALELVHYHWMMNNLHIKVMEPLYCEGLIPSICWKFHLFSLDLYRGDSLANAMCNECYPAILGNSSGLSSFPIAEPCKALCWLPLWHSWRMFLCMAPVAFGQGNQWGQAGTEVWFASKANLAVELSQAWLFLLLFETKGCGLAVGLSRWG